MTGYNVAAAAYLLGIQRTWLHDLIKRGVVKAPPRLGRGQWPRYAQYIHQAKVNCCRRALKSAGGNVAKAARLIGTSKDVFYQLFTRGEIARIPRKGYGNAAWRALGR